MHQKNHTKIKLLGNLHFHNMLGQHLKIFRIMEKIIKEKDSFSYSVKKVLFSSKITQIYQIKIGNLLQCSLNSKERGFVLSIKMRNLLKRHLKKNRSYLVYMEI